MTHTPVLRRLVFALALGGFFVGPLSAQNVLFAELDGKLLPVVRARGNSAFVEVDGKLVAANGQQYGLQKVEEYRPEVVTVRNLDVKTRYMGVEGSEINHEFLFNAVVETPYYLDDVFIVLALNTDKAGQVLFLQEVGNLAPGNQKTISVRVPMSSGLGQGKYEFHLFSSGRELLNTNMSPEFRDKVLDRMIHKRIAGVQDAAPKLFNGPQPEYPSSLLKTGVAGHVMIALRIGAKGQVYDPTVVSASDPAFGEAALTAVRLWRFLPQVKQGRPVETKSVNVPLNFTPPPKKG